MSWTGIYDELIHFIETEEFQNLLDREIDGDKKQKDRGLSIALREVYNTKNPWGHKL